MSLILKPRSVLGRWRVFEISPSEAGFNSAEAITYKSKALAR